MNGYLQALIDRYSRAYKIQMAKREKHIKTFLLIYRI